MILSNLKQFFIKNKKAFYYVFFLFSIFIISGDFAFAEDPVVNPDLDKYIAIVEGLLKLVSIIMTLFTYLATIFLSPNWINGTLFGLDTYLKDIWILVSNVVYFIFAFVLIWIAFMNIIGKEGDQYQLKQALPKFIVGVLIVPFSWFLVQFILSISAILTVSALTLPFDTFDNYGTKIGQIEIPQKCILNLDSGKADEGENSDGFISCPEGGEVIKLNELMSGGDSVDSIFGIMSMYTFGILNLDSVDDIDFSSSGIKTIGDLLVKVVTDVLLVFIYLILMIALGMVLFVRGLYIWIYTMMSPIFGLMYFFDKKEGAGDGFFSKFNIKEFIALAMVPVYAMLALSFGLLFIYVIGEGISNTQGKAPIPGGITIGDESITVGRFTLEMNASGLTSAGKFLKDASDSGLGIIGNLIIKVFGIVLLWGALMAAMRASEITKVVVEPLHAFGGKVGSIVASSPGNLPIFGGQSMRSMGTVASGIEGHISQSNTDRGNKFLDKTPFGNSSVTKSMQNLQSEIMRATSQAEKATLMQKILKNTNGDFKQVYSNSSSQKALFDLVSKIKPEILNDLKIDKFSDINNGSLVAKIYEKVESQGNEYKGILIENEGQINEAAMIKATNKLKDNDTTIDPKNSQNLNIDSTEDLANDIIKIKVSGDSLDFRLDGGKLKDADGNKDKFIKLFVKALSDGYSTNEIKTSIFDKFSNSKDILNGNIYYDKKNKTYGIVKTDDNDEVEDVSKIFDGTIDG